MNQKGVTLIELMIVLLITSIVMTSVMGAIIAQQSSSSRQSSVQQVQQTGQLVLTMVKRDIMMAGYGVDPDLALYVQDGGSGAGAGPDTLYINDSSFLDNDKVLNDIYGHVEVTGAGTTINATDLDFDSDSNDEFIGGIWQFVITDDNNQKATNIVAINGNQLTLGASVTANNIAPAIVYCVDVDGTVANCVPDELPAPSAPTLLLSNKSTNGRQSVADNIVDMQIAYQDNAGTWYGTTANPTPPANFVWSTIRFVRVNLIARSAANRDGMGVTASAENGRSWGGGGADDFIYRMYTIQMSLRNLK